MRNLDWLYDTDEPFRNAVCGAAAEWLGSTSENFADAWLRERHHEPDEACLLGQHAEPEEVDSREKLEADALHEARFMCATEKLAQANVGKIIDLLDRQAAITRREWEGPLMKAGRDAVEIERSIAEEYRADAIAAQKELENTKRAMNRAAGKWAKADADATEWMHIIDFLEDRIAERDKRIDKLMQARTLPCAERVRELEEEIEYLKHECDEWEEDWEAMKAERDGLKRERAEMDDELDAVEKERDAYRELCGRMRKMANEMLVMEVD